jgi:hypothetical protein
VGATDVPGTVDGMPARPAPVVPGAHPGDLTALVNVCGLVDAGPVVVTGPDTALTYATVLDVARCDATAHRHATDPADPLLDVHPAVPDTGTWTVAEVEEKIIRPARTRPLVRGHVVVADAHAMAPIAADRLLKTLEEPRTDVVFWLVTPDAADLRPTIAARAVRHAHVRPVPAADRVAAVHAAGADPDTAARACAAAGDDTRLAAAAALTGRVDALQRYATTAATWATAAPACPTAAAAAAFDDVCALAGALAGQRTTAWDQLNPTARAEARRLVRRLLDAVAAHAARDCATDLARASAVHDAVTVAHAALATGTPVWAVLAAVANRCAHPHVTA